MEMNDTEMSILNGLTDALKFAEGKTDDAKVYNDEMIKAAQRAQDYIDGKNRNGFHVFETVEEAMDDLLNEKD